MPGQTSTLWCWWRASTHSCFRVQAALRQLEGWGEGPRCTAGACAARVRVRAPRYVDCDVVVAEVRETSRKPDEMYTLLERLSPGTRKLEVRSGGGGEGGNSARIRLRARRACRFAARRPC